MVSNEPPKRRYVAPRRQAKAQATREAMLDAAERLFLANGYAGTSIHAVAVAAGVTDTTVFQAFKDKPSLLWAVGSRMLSGVEEPDPLGETALTRAMRAEPNPRRRLRLVMGQAKESYRRGLFDFEAVLIEAAASDTRVRALTGEVLETRLAHNRMLVGLILEGAGLPADVSLDDVAAFIDAIDSAPVFRLLTGTRGWSVEQYADWMTMMFERTFLA